MFTDYARQSLSESVRDTNDLVQQGIKKKKYYSFRNDIISNIFLVFKIKKR